jgi:hypothetical protein
MRLVGREKEQIVKLDGYGKRLHPGRGKCPEKPILRFSKTDGNGSVRMICDHSKMRRSRI